MNYGKTINTKIMENLIYEVVNEFKTDVEGLTFRVSGRILKSKLGDSGLNVDYMWEVSHYCKQEANAIDVYRPSNIFGKTYAEAESRLLKYMKLFTSFDIEENEFY